MAAPDAPDDQQAHDNDDIPDVVCALASRDCLASSASRLGLVRVASWSTALARACRSRVVSNLLGGAFKVQLVRT
jgi:hypothetical protein